MNPGFIPLHWEGHGAIRMMWIGREEWGSGCLFGVIMPSLAWNSGESGAEKLSVLATSTRGIGFVSIIHL
jgi:hypothetical protein